jgi:ankyrin repeat protein
MLEKLLEQRKREVKNVHNIKLIHAIQKENIKRVKKCIDKGFDIKERDEMGATSLHYAGNYNVITMQFPVTNQTLKLKLAARTSWKC